VPVAQNHRPPGADIIDVGIVIGVEQATPIGAVNKAWQGANRFTRPDRTVDPAGYHLLGILKEYGRTIGFHLRESFSMVSCVRFDGGIVWCKGLHMS
jgi:hypothetical protein